MWPYQYMPLALFWHWAIPLLSPISCSSRWDLPSSDHQVKSMTCNGLSNCQKEYLLWPFCWFGVSCKDALYCCCAKSISPRLGPEPESELQQLPIVPHHCIPILYIHPRWGAFFLLFKRGKIFVLDLNKYANILPPFLVCHFFKNLRLFYCFSLVWWVCPYLSWN